jgi:hypothetical protein
VAQTNVVAEAPKTWDEITAVAQRVEKGDKAALAALRGALRNPEVVDVLGGDLARQAQLTLIHKFAGTNALYRETLPRKLDHLREELAGPNPSPVERLLADRVASCWLHLHHLEMIYAGKDSMTLALAAHYQRCIDRAHNRYLSALKALALVRKLAMPVLQVNIAKKQVNVAGPCDVATA